MNFIRNSDGSYKLSQDLISPIDMNGNNAIFAPIFPLHDPENFLLLDSVPQSKTFEEKERSHANLPPNPLEHTYNTAMERTPLTVNFPFLHRFYQESSPLSMPSSPRVPNLTCSLCGKVFKHRGDVMRHMQNVHVQREACVFCGKQLKINGRSDAKIKHFARCPRFVALLPPRTSNVPELAKRAYHLLKHKIPISLKTLNLQLSEIQEEARKLVLTPALISSYPVSILD
eukprot:NODE_340_length_10646_cov_0.202522.p3 type:complete len:229 gc:universal NODE_340_length_10646_cov_0.202522:3125-3811(+)